MLFSASQDVWVVGMWCASAIRHAGAMSLPIPDSAAVDEARSLLADAHAVTVLTGAGISTDSGIPDFRGPNGLWTKNPKAERTSNIEHYVRDPEVRRLAWEGRIAWMEREVEPNPGHLALVDLERSGRLHLLVTSPQTSEFQG